MGRRQKALPSTVRRLLSTASLSRVTTLLLACAAAFSILGLPARARQTSPPPGANPALNVFDPVDVGRPPLKVFTDQDGLPQNAINALAYDPQRYLWVGTKDGAAFYNGRVWTTVNIPSRNNTNWVECILVASDGTVWIGTLGGGLLTFKNGTWTQQEPEPGISNEITCLYEAKDQNGETSIWVGTHDGLLRYTQGVWTKYKLFESSPDGAIQCLYQSTGADGVPSLWAGSNVGMARLRENAWTYYNRGTGLPEDRISAFRETSAFGTHMLVATTYGSGLIWFDGSNWLPLPASSACPSPLLNSIHETTGPDGAPVLWVGTSTGLGRFANGRWVLLGKEQGIPGSVWSFQTSETTAGTRTLWMGTSGYGLIRWEQGRWTAFDESVGMNANSTYAVLVSKDAEGNRTLWAGTNDGGISRLENGRWLTHTPLTTGFRDTSIHCLIETDDPDGGRSIWAGLHAMGLGRYRNGQWTYYDTANGLPNVSVSCLLDTTSETGAHGMWVGTARGLVWMENDRFSAPPASLQLPDQRIRTMLETTASDGGRTLWVGTENGLVRYERGQSTVYSTANGLPNNVVMSITLVAKPDGRRWLWAGTRGGGVGVLTLHDPAQSWRTVSTSTLPGFPNNTVYQILQDSRERIYLCTNKGIARLTEGDAGPDGFPMYSTYVFTTEDGLPSNECNTGASAIDDLGRLWVGTIGGVAVLDPRQEIVDSTLKPLRIERAWLVERSRPLSSGDVLAYDENHILFEFALLSFFREETTSYQTQLIGFDGSPSSWSRDFKKEYTSLPKGDYVFRVWGRDDEGNITGPVEIPFHIKAAPWFTWWAYLLYVAALAGLAYLLVRYRLRSLRRYNESLEERILVRTAELAQKVEQLGISERHALDARNAALESEFRARESERKAIEASRSKSVFLANMSHELRTPLNAILGFVQLMERDRALTGEQRENLGVIMRSGEHLLALINDVLSLSKIEAGRVALNIHVFDLLRLLQGLEEMFRLRAEMKRLQLIVDLAPDLPQYVVGDEAKLRQVLINLLGNAVKFTRVGQVVLRAWWADDRAFFAVEDTGPGIAPEEMSKLFQAFVQTQTGHQSTEGTGLGLAISRNYVMLMDGHVSVESDPGHGSIFRIEISLPVANDVEMTNSNRTVIGLEPGEPRYRILVVDDIEENRTLLAKLLMGVGFDVQLAANGREAIDLWSAWAPDLIFMDMRMPVMDGLEATIRIRKSERRMAAESAMEGIGLIQHCKIIALTASAFDHDRAEILSSGCDDFIPKPFREAQIFDKLEQHTGARFLYDDTLAQKPVNETAQLDARAIIASRLSGVSPDLLADLSEAVTIGDVEAALSVVDRLRNGDELLATELRTLVRKYRFDEILNLIGNVRESE